jgi:hypothetical protein
MKYVDKRRRWNDDASMTAEFRVRGEINCLFIEVQYLRMGGSTGRGLKQGKAELVHMAYEFGNGYSGSGCIIVPRKQKCDPVPQKCRIASEEVQLRAGRSIQNFYFKKCKNSVVQFCTQSVYY